MTKLGRDIEKKLCCKIPHLVVVDFLTRVFLCSSVIRSISLTEQRKHDHKILSTLPIYFSVYLVITVSSKTQREQVNGKVSTVHCQMNVEQAVAIDVFSALFL